MKAVWKTDCGRQRKNNEDAVYVKGNMFVVADGMGGHNAGEVASRMAVEAVSKIGADAEADCRGCLLRTFDEANRNIFAAAKGERAGMGTTMDVCIYREGNLHIGHVGDSRVYLLRRGHLKQITVDHSYVEMLISRGEITAEEAKDYPMKNMITRAVGVADEVQMDYCVQKIEEGDRILACTDGLTNMLSDKDIARLVDESDSLEVALDSLIAAANEAGGRDNISVVLADFSAKGE